MKKKTSRADKVAIYWDFENIHASLVDEKFGDGAYRKMRYNRQEQLVEVKAVMNYAASLGEIAINRAYADWSRLQGYRFQLLDFSIDLIQLYPRGMNAKNGADIRIVLDAVEDIHHFPHIGHVIIIGGDSDYVGLAQKMRQAGKHVTGVGVQGATNSFWERACNAFKFYRTLLAKADDRAALEELKAVSDIGVFQELARRVLRDAMAERGELWVPMGAVGSRLVRLDPTFDPANYGFRSLGDLLKACNHGVQLKRGEHDYLVTLAEEPVMIDTRPGKALAVPAASAPMAVPAGESRAESTVAAYQQILVAAAIKVPPVRFRRQAIGAMVQAFAKRPVMPSVAEIDLAIAGELRAMNLPDAKAEVRKVRHLCQISKSFAFEPNHGGIRLAITADAIELLIARKLMSTLLQQVEVPLDRLALGEILFDHPTPLPAEIEAILQEVEHQQLEGGNGEATATPEHESHVPEPPASEREPAAV